jgi:hypothetical protein
VAEPAVGTAGGRVSVIRGAIAALLSALALSGCGSDASTLADGTLATDVPPAVSFFTALGALCGQAFEGRVIEDSAADSAFAASTLVMHVRECADSVIRVPFHVGEDRSRTWVVSRTLDGLRLKHDHRHADGSEDAVTQYGGDSPGPGTATVQEFAADAHTASLIPAAATNVWTMELEPGTQFVYALRREGTDRRFRVAFDLTRAVPAPPAPWGFE